MILEGGFMKMVLSLIAGLVTLPLFAHHGPVSNVLAAHNALHKVEHLVEEKLLDEDFNSELKWIGISRKEADYDAVIEQYPGTTGVAARVEVDLDSAGEAKDYRLVSNEQAMGAPTWPDLPAINLLEQALHHVIRNANKPAIAPFAKDLSRAQVSQSVAGSKITAVVDVKSSSDPKTLQITLNTAGKVLSATVISTPQLGLRPVID